MNKILSAIAVVALSCPWVVSAGSDSYQYCNDMYPADSYDAQERGQYIQECLQAYNDAGDSYSVTQAAEEESYETTDVHTEEAPYYEGTVEEFVGDQPLDESQYDD